MGNAKEERDVFEGFISADPDFAGSRVIGWSQPPSDPPDVACELEGGKKVGVELTSWLDESQIGRARKQEMIEDSFREAIDPEPPNDTEHIFLVWMAAKRRMLPADGAAFRAELIAAVDEIDRRWDREPSWHTPQGFLWADFLRFPTLAKYLESLDIHPRIPSAELTMKKGGRHWLTFPMPGGAYSPDWMVDALFECVRAKINKYAAKPAGMDEFYLLVHYDKAYIYNSPVKGIGFGFADAVRAVAARINHQVGHFDRIFVYVPVTKGPQVFRLYP